MQVAPNTYPAIRSRPMPSFRTESLTQKMPSRSSRTSARLGTPLPRIRMKGFTRAPMPWKRKKRKRKSGIPKKQNSDGPAKKTAIAMTPSASRPNTEISAARPVSMNVLRALSAKPSTWGLQIPCSYVSTEQRPSVPPVIPTKIARGPLATRALCVCLTGMTEASVVPIVVSTIAHRALPALTTSRRTV